MFGMGEHPTNARLHFLSLVSGKTKRFPTTNETEALEFPPLPSVWRWSVSTVLGILGMGMIPITVQGGVPVRLFLMSDVAHIFTACSLWAGGNRAAELCFFS